MFQLFPGWLTYMRVSKNHSNRMKTYNCLGNVINQPQVPMKVISPPQTRRPFDITSVLLQTVVGMMSWWERLLYKPLYVLFCVWHLFPCKAERYYFRNITPLKSILFVLLNSAFLICSKVLNDFRWTETFFDMPLVY